MYICRCAFLQKIFSLELLAFHIFRTKAEHVRKSAKEILCVWTLKYVNKIPGRRVPTSYWPIVTFPPDLTASKQPRCAEASVTMATMTSAACQWSGFVHEKEWMKKWMRKWRIKREAVKKGWEEIWERGWKEREHGYPHFIALCYQGNRSM